jgi:hypothetical protein
MDWIVIKDVAIENVKRVTLDYLMITSALRAAAKGVVPQRIASMCTCHTSTMIDRAMNAFSVRLRFSTTMARLPDQTTQVGLAHGADSFSLAVCRPDDTSSSRIQAK